LAVSAVSKRISELESQVGSPLLVRNARGVENGLLLLSRFRDDHFDAGYQ
jgi:DNA-binding transcriptional LysR family regulator